MSLVPSYLSPVGTATAVSLTYTGIIDLGAENNTFAAGHSEVTIDGRAAYVSNATTGFTQVSGTGLELDTAGAAANQEVAFRQDAIENVCGILFDPRADFLRVETVLDTVGTMSGNNDVGGPTIVHTPSSDSGWWDSGWSGGYPSGCLAWRLRYRGATEGITLRADFRGTVDERKLTYTASDGDVIDALSGLGGARVRRRTALTDYQPGDYEHMAGAFPRSDDGTTADEGDTDNPYGSDSEVVAVVSLGNNGADTKVMSSVRFTIIKGA